MRKHLAMLLLASLVVGSAGCQKSVDEKTKTVADEIIAREKASFDAWKRKDKAFYDDYWAANMTEFLPDEATLARKAELMPRFDEMAAKWKLDAVEMLNPDVQVLGNVAILTYNENVSGTYDGRPMQYAGKVTMIYVKQKGVWRGVHYHESK
jgi:ketosteroid isomerase-like protein